MARDPRVVRARVTLEAVDIAQYQTQSRLIVMTSYYYDQLYVMSSLSSDYFITHSRT